MRKLRDEHYRLQNQNIAGDSALLADLVAGDTLEIQAEFRLGSATEFGFKVRRGPSEETLVGYDVNSKQMFVDRTRSGRVDFSSDFPGRHTASRSPQNDKVSFHIFVDRCSVEVFGNDGQTVLTELIFPDPNSQGIQLYSRNGNAKLVSLDIWKLRSAWQPMNN